MTSVTVLPCAGVPAAEQIWTIVVGGGSGRRFGLAKQYEALGEVRVIDRSVAVAREVSDGVVVVVPPEDAEREGAIAGGATRSESVRAGLAAVPLDATIICVHDAAGWLNVAVGDHPIAPEPSESSFLKISLRM